MRIYRLDYRTKATTDEGTHPMHTEWFTSERAAVVRRLELFDKGQLLGKKRDAEIWGEEIPTKKVELVEWLNANWSE